MNNKLQKENVELKRDKRNPGKPEATPTPRKASIKSRQTLYIPSTQKLGLLASKQKKAKDSSLLDNFEPDENKIDEIESNIFNKISESVDKIFNSQFDSRSTFSGYKMESKDLMYNPEKDRLTTNKPNPNRKRSIEDKFKEIAELPEEEERETLKRSTKEQHNRSTTFFFDEESSNSYKSNSDDEGAPTNLREYTLKIKESEDLNENSKTEVDHEALKELKEEEEKLINEINILHIEVEDEEKEQDQAEHESEIDHDEIIDVKLIDTHFENEATEEDKKEDLKIQENLKFREYEVESLDGALMQKQEILEAIIESNKEMKKSIVDTMKQEYLKKIIALQNEIKKMEGQKERDLNKAKTESTKTSVNNEYQKKIKAMEKELKEIKKKDKDQVDKLRISKQQSEKIKALSSEIENMKSQKVKLQRQIKEEKEKHRKWKDEKTNMIMKMKRANQKKDKEISTLKRENDKKSNILRRKVEELKALQNRQKLEISKHRKALDQKRVLKKIDPEKIKNWVSENTEKLMRYQDIKEELEKEIEIRNQTEKEIAEEQNNYAVVQTKKEKLESKLKNTNSLNKDLIDEIDFEIRGYKLELNSITENMNSLEDKLEFVSEKISVYEKEVIEINPEGIERLRFEEINNLEEAKIYLGSFFNIFLEMNVYRSMIENKIMEQDEIIDKFKAEVSELNSKLQASEIKFREEINKMAIKYEEKQEFIKAEINEFMKLDLIANLVKEDGLENLYNSSPGRVKKEKSIGDMGIKNTKQLRDEIKQRKQALRDVARVQATSKIGLSKMVTTLEKQTQEDEKKIEILGHKLQQAAHEKQMFKQKYQTLKAKVKTSETEDIKLIKTISLETREKNKAVSPIRSHKNVVGKEQLTSLQQARKDK